MADTATTRTSRALPSDADHTGRSFGAEELANLQKVIESGTLNCTRGRFVIELEKQFAKSHGLHAARAVNSGSMAVQTAVAAVDPEPGDEIISTPVTDMGAISAILYQAAIPIFADVDPVTLNVTAETIEKRITKRTRAIIVTHLFGNPCDMDPIMKLAAKHGLPVIEDAAQAFFAEYKGVKVGGIGDYGCFSLQQGKHMTAGEGGLVTAKDATKFRRAVLYSDKAWGYGDPNPDHYFLAPNARMTELQGAVALAQLEKCEAGVETRIRNARLMEEMIAGVEGVETPQVLPGCKHVYWRYAINIDPKILKGGVDAFSANMKDLGVFTAPRYIKKPAYACQVIRDRVTFGKSGFPFEGPHRAGEPPIEYRDEDFPGTFEGLSRVCVLPWNEKFTEADVEYIGEAITDAARKLQ